MTKPKLNHVHGLREALWAQGTVPDGEVGSHPSEQGREEAARSWQGEDPALNQRILVIESHVSHAPSQGAGTCFSTGEAEVLKQTQRGIKYFQQLHVSINRSHAPATQPVAFTQIKQKQKLGKHTCRWATNLWFFF